MTYAGARGETERQMADTLGFNLARDRLHPAFNNLGLQLASRGAEAKGQDGEGFRLNIANAVWGQDDHEFLEAYLDLLTDNYGSGVRPMDFKEAPEESRITINDWVADQTEDRIKDLIPQSAIDKFTRLILTNAIYFNAAWQHPFNVRSTHPGPFFMLDGSTVDVPMMNQTTYFGYAKADGYQALVLPYDSFEMSMTIILPDEGRFREFEDSIDADIVTQILEDIWPRSPADHAEIRVPIAVRTGRTSLQDGDARRVRRPGSRLFRHGRHVVSANGRPTLFDYLGRHSRGIRIGG